MTVHAVAAWLVGVRLAEVSPECRSFWTICIHRAPPRCSGPRRPNAASLPPSGKKTRHVQAAIEWYRSDVAVSVCFHVGLGRIKFDIPELLKPRNQEL